MTQLRRDYLKFKDEETEILVVGPESSASFSRYWNEKDLPFIGLPDPKHQVLKLFGQEIKIFKFGRMPAMAVIDKYGIVRLVHYGKSMSDIPKNADVLKAVRQFTMGNED